MRRISGLLCIVIVVLVPVFILTGCGGGGGGNSGVISGTVNDAAGNLIPGARIEVIGSSKRTESLFNGAYKLTGVEPGWVTVKASATINGVAWIGYRAAQSFDNGPSQSMNIVIGPVDELGEFSGVVTNAAGDPVENARIFASSQYPKDAAGPDSSFVSMVAFTDRNGHYSLTDVPSSIEVNNVKQQIRYKLVASSAGVEGMPRGFENDEQSGELLPSADGFHTPVDFVLQVSSDIQVDTPADWYVNISSWTMPNDIISRGPGGYDAVRAHISKDFSSALKARKGVKRSPPAGSLIEIDVSWLTSWTEFLDSYYSGSPQPNLAGFAIYRREGSSPTVSDTDQLDFVRDPFLTFYGDTSSRLTAGHRYYYGVTAISTSYLDENSQFNPDAESVMSDTISVVPIGQVKAVNPVAGATLTTGTLAFSWSDLSDAASYQVFLYNEYPVVTGGAGEATDNVTLPVWESSVVTGTSVRYNGGALIPGTYYWVVIGSSDSNFSTGPAFTIGELRSVRIR